MHSNELKKQMESVGITAYRLSKLSGVSQSTISRILNKEDYSPTLKTWDKLIRTITKNK